TASAASPLSAGRADATDATDATKPAAPTSSWCTAAAGCRSTTDCDGPARNDARNTAGGLSARIQSRSCAATATEPIFDCGPAATPPSPPMSQHSPHLLLLLLRL